MAKKICGKCGSEIKDSRGEKVERASVMRLLKVIHVEGIQEKDEETKDFCFKCWKIEHRSMMKPFAQMLGKTADDW